MEHCFTYLIELESAYGNNRTSNLMCLVLTTRTCWYGKNYFYLNIILKTSVQVLATLVIVNDGASS